MSLTLRILRAMYRDTEYTAAEISEMVHVDGLAAERELIAMEAAGMVMSLRGGRYRKASKA